jgi:hypothetical protein
LKRKTHPHSQSARYDSHSIRGFTLNGLLTVIAKRLDWARTLNDTDEAPVGSQVLRWKRRNDASKNGSRIDGRTNEKMRRTISRSRIGKLVVVASSFSWLILTGCAAERAPATILMDGQFLAETKQRLAEGDVALKPAFDRLLNQAEEALNAGPYSVMDKSKLPPSMDPHDYASYARYWWPDPTQPDGKPYIRRDGETNPDSQSPAESDRIRMDLMVGGAETLGLAYFLTGEARYAEKAAELLRTWFIDPATRMNPNLNFAQGIPGVYHGSKFGIIDSRIFCRALDGALLIADSSALTADEMEALREWAGDYLDWLKTSDLGVGAAEATNNHSVFFDVQSMYFALFSGDTDYARELAENAVDRRILKQIAPDGSLPKELARTRSLHYSIFCVQAFLQLAHLAEQVDVDLWHVADSRIRSALDYIRPHANPALPWPSQDVSKANRLNLLWPLLYAAEKYSDTTYSQLAEQLPAQRKDRRANLVAPLMR